MVMRPNAVVVDRGLTGLGEVLIDYSTTIGDDDTWTTRCRCSSPACRKTIRRFGSLPQPLQIRYLRDGLVPGYIVRTLIQYPRLSGADAR